MPLITPITDRAQADASYADAHKSNPEYFKGALNLEYDLNRIESNCGYLASQLISYGYPASITVKTDWTMNDFLSLTSANRIRDNINTLINAFHKLPGSPDIRYWDGLDFTDANSLEQNIKNIDTLLQRMAAVFLRCGEAHGGDQ